LLVIARKKEKGNLKCDTKTKTKQTKKKPPNTPGLRLTLSPSQTTHSFVTHERKEMWDSKLRYLPVSVKKDSIHKRPRYTVHCEKKTGSQRKTVVEWGT